MDLIELAIVGFATGIGSAIGNYAATKYVITHLDMIKEKLREAVKDENQR